MWKQLLADRYRQAKKAASAAVAEAKARIWEFGAPLEKDSRTAPKCFWKTIQASNEGKADTVQAVLSKDGENLTTNGDVV